MKIVNSQQYNNINTFKGVKTDTADTSFQQDIECKKDNVGLDAIGNYIKAFIGARKLTDEEFNTLKNEIRKNPEFDKIKEKSLIIPNRHNILLIKQILQMPELLNNKNFKSYSRYLISSVDTSERAEVAAAILTLPPDLWDNVNFANRIGNILYSVQSNDNVNSKISVIKEISSIKKNNPDLWNNKNFSDNIVSILRATDTPEQAKTAKELLKLPSNLWNNENFVFNVNDIIDKSNPTNIDTKIKIIQNMNKKMQNSSELANNKVFQNQIGNIIFITDTQEVEEYIENMDLLNLVKTAPEMYNFSRKDMDTFLNYHIKNGTTKFSKEDLTCPFDLEKKLSSELIPQSELTKILSVFPKTKKEIGSIPDDWGVNEDKKKQIKIYDAISKFAKEKDVSQLEQNLKNILEKDVRIKRIDEGSFGVTYKLSMENAKACVIKAFFDTPKKVFSHYDEHGAGNEPQFGLYAKNNNVTNFAKFYFGKLSNSNDTDGFMVNEFLDKENPPEQSIHDRLGLFLMNTKDIRDDNVIGKTIIDYGDAYLENDVTPEVYNIALNIVDNVLDFKDEKFVIKQDISTYLDKLEITPEVKQEDIFKAIDYIKTKSKNCPKKLINNMNSWSKNKRMTNGDK